MGSLDLNSIRQDPTVANVWYTAAEVSGQGYISVLAIFNGTDHMDRVHLKIEIDGDAPGGWDLENASAPFNKDLGGAHRKTVQIPLDVRFEEGFKISVMDDTGGSDLRCSVVWTIDQ